MQGMEELLIRQGAMFASFFTLVLMLYLVVNALVRK